MLKTLKIRDIQKTINILNIEKPVKILYKETGESFIQTKNKQNISPSCINCINPCCTKVLFSSLESNHFPNFSHNTNLSLCPTQAILKTTTGIVINHDKCIGCGLCAKNCPIGAIVLKNGKAYIQKKHTSYQTELPNNEDSQEIQHKFIQQFSHIHKEGLLVKENEQYFKGIYSAIQKMSQEERNLFARNLLISLGNQATISRQGNVYLRLDGFYDNANQWGVVEIETGSDVLDVARALLDDIAVLNTRYNLSKMHNHPLAILLSFPNKRTDYWQLIKDIKNITGVQFNTVTFGVLLMLLWNFIDINEFDNFYIDIDHSSVRSVVEKLLKRKIDIKDGFLSIFELEK